MKRQIGTVFLAALMLLGTAACGKTKQTNETPIVGGWTLTAAEAVTLPEKLQETFTKAVEGKSLTPIALVGTQVVAGTNYMLLCAENGAYRMVVLYCDLQGGAELTRSSAFALTDYTQSGTEAPAEPLPGGWTAPEELTVLPLPERAQTAFDKAADGFVGSHIEPMALLGTQVVAGTNHAFLCQATVVVPDAQPEWMVVYLYQDLQGEISVLDIGGFDVGAFCDYGSDEDE